MDTINVRPKSVNSVEKLTSYCEGGFHPIHLNDTFKSGRYEVIHKLGNGGFATVWLARDNKRERYVALKVLASRLSKDSPEIDMLRLMRMSPEHVGKPYVQPLLDHFHHHGPNGDHLCLVSEVGGPSIKHFNDCPGEYKGSRRLESSMAKRVSLQAANALTYIHATGIVHGDFTPANILLQLANIDEWTVKQIYERLGFPQKKVVSTSSSLPESQSSFPDYQVSAINMKEINPKWLTDNITIIDFGIAFLQNQPSTGFGTPKSYCAPEFLFGSHRSMASDIWALGCTIFEIRTGHRLFKYTGSPTRDEMLIATVKLLGTLPIQWWNAWLEGKKWYELQTETARGSKGNIFDHIMETGAHDGEHRPAQLSRRKDDDLALVESFKKSSSNGKTDKLILMAEDLGTSDARQVVELANGAVDDDFGQGKYGSDSNKDLESFFPASSNARRSEAKSSEAKSPEAKSPEAKSSKAKSSKAKSSKAKSPEAKSSPGQSSEPKSSPGQSSEPNGSSKSPSSEHVVIGGSKNKGQSSEGQGSSKTSSDRIEIGSSKGIIDKTQLSFVPEETETSIPVHEGAIQSVIRNETDEMLPFTNIQLCVGPARTHSFLEPSGIRISIAEAKLLEDFLRKSLKYLPEQRITALEAGNHNWFSDVPQNVNPKPVLVTTYAD
ncbi:hypothetical protein NHQ30_001378 [Ciborinia camelliae]|nr:hypothetical protein NHQ30_001378 [Ciborinia camelliae]